MREESLRQVDRWWSTVLAVPADELWRGTTVTPHAANSPLALYGGWWVVWGRDGLHVSLPDDTRPPARSLLADPERRTEPSSWRAVARERRLRVVGPSVHAYLDIDPGPSTGVVDVAAEDLEDLRLRVGASAWGESGFRDLDPVVDPCFALVQGGEVVAASNLTPYDGAPRDVGVLVDPRSRGRGLGAQVGAHAAAHAVRHHGLARWRARTDNRASLATAVRLGFEPWCRQLALRR